MVQVPKRPKITTKMFLAFLIVFYINFPVIEGKQPIKNRLSKIEVINIQSFTYLICFLSGPPTIQTNSEVLEIHKPIKRVKRQWEYEDYYDDKAYDIEYQLNNVSITI